MSLNPGVHQVDVDGGTLAVEVVSSGAGGTEPVLAIHGISSTRKLWNWLHHEAPDITLIAPDLRGRADSYDVKGASSVAQHADDMIAVLDHFGIEQVHVCGMSMGGFIAVELATRYPSRTKSLVLVDGGFPMAQPPGLTRELLPAVFADRLARLDKEFGSAAEYAEFFTANTGPLLDVADPLLQDYMAHDLKGGKVQLSGEALLGDAESVFFGEPQWQSLTLPVRFSHAEWATGTGTPPAYSAAAVEEYSTKTVRTVFVPGTDHAASIMSAAGAKVAAELIREALA